MPAKNFWLRKKQLLKKVILEGKTIVANDFSIKILRNNFSYPRFCVIAPKKIFKKAVERNKAKRRTKEMIRKVLPQLSFNYDIIVFPKKEVLNKKFENLLEEIRELLKTIN